MKKGIRSVDTPFDRGGNQKGGKYEKPSSSSSQLREWEREYITLEGVACLFGRAL